MLSSYSADMRRTFTSDKETEMNLVRFKAAWGVNSSEVIRRAVAFYANSNSKYLPDAPIRTRKTKR